MLHVQRKFKVNLLKTNQRNIFTAPGIAAHIFVKEGLCDSDDKNCTNFRLTKKMMDNMNKNIYQNVHENFVFLLETMMLMLKKLMKRITVVF